MIILIVLLGGVLLFFGLYGCIKEYHDDFEDYLKNTYSKNDNNIDILSDWMYSGNDSDDTPI